MRVRPRPRARGGAVVLVQAPIGDGDGGPDEHARSDPSANANRTQPRHPLLLAPSRQALVRSRGWWWGGERTAPLAGSDGDVRRAKRSRLVPSVYTRL